MDVNVFNETWDVIRSINQIFEGGKKSYLASIESLEDSDSGGDGSENVSTSDNNTTTTSPTTNTTTSSSSNNNININNNITTINNINYKKNNNIININNNNNHNNLSNHVDHDDNSIVMNYTEHVIMEIVETERTYVNDLSEIIEGYLIYFKRLISNQGSTPPTTTTTTSLSSLSTPASSTSSSSSRNKCFICVDQLFGNIEDIFKFNSKFLSQLEDCDFKPRRIAKCFIQQSKGFDVYTQYCTNYPRTVSLLTDLMTNKETAEIFRERQLFLKHSLPLGSYLLKPVQRILKYHLLLQNIVKDNDLDESGEDDIYYLRQALSVMTNIAAHINEMKRKHEHAVRVQEIQSLLYGWEGQDLTTYGELVAEGSFRMIGAKAVRHLFLLDKMLLITKKREDGLLSYKAHIMCSNLMVIESIEGEPFCFQTIPFDCPRIQYTFQSRNLDHKREWCLQLKRLMLENYPMPIPSNAKQIVMKLGLPSSFSSTGSNGKSGSGSGKESGSGKSGYGGVGSGRRTPSAPEYLEKRKQERRKSSDSSHSTTSNGGGGGSLHKGFKLRKSLKKIQPFDLTMMNGSKRSRSASTDETAMNLLKREESLKIDRRSSLGTITKPPSLQEEEPITSQTNNTNNSLLITSCDVVKDGYHLNHHHHPLVSHQNYKLTSSSTTTLSTTTSSNSSLASLEKSLLLGDNMDGLGNGNERCYWSGLRRSSSRCSARKLANDYLKRASISESGYGDDYVSFYFCNNGLSRRDSINGSIMSSNGIVNNNGSNGNSNCSDIVNRDRSSTNHGFSLSSGSSELSMTSMVSSTPSDNDSIMCICKAYRQLNSRSTPRQGQSSSSSSSSSSTSSSTSSFTDTGLNSVTGSNNHIGIESSFDEYIPCLCGSTCEQRSRLFNSNSGEDSGLGSICSGSSSNSSFSSARTSTPLSAGSSELSMASSSHSSSTDDYHHILSTLAGGIGNLDLTDHPGSSSGHNVRRAQSFTGMVKTKTALLTHTLSFRHAPQLDLPPCCNLTHTHQNQNQYHHHHHHHPHHQNNSQQQQKYNNNPHHHHHHHHYNNHHRSQLQQNNFSSQPQSHQEEQLTEEKQQQQVYQNNDNSHSDDSAHDISSSSSSSHHHNHHHYPRPLNSTELSQTTSCSSSSSTSPTSSSASTTTTTPPFSSSSLPSPLSNVSFSRDPSSVRLPSSSSLEEMSPTSPAIWLRKQSEHFPPACKKGGSLPRSFESTAFTTSSQL
ncbi:putative uncharacterized protein DDB_G0277255 isoform X2 [Panonychus citri]|uniref:putative uncharacterized protein DDB_G0277255 isoform X2 n=1 Tax=Panonychus citri TaxID=50023 RepID=UPI0023077476|nr:putative uncharacterized protein DDB_G0277255 isoform X2 [Panonychus citri]